MSDLRVSGGQFTLSGKVAGEEEAAPGTCFQEKSDWKYRLGQEVSKQG